MIVCEHCSQYGTDGDMILDKEDATFLHDDSLSNRASMCRMAVVIFLVSKRKRIPTGQVARSDLEIGKIMR
jgi:hypothetical protein